MTKIPTTRQIIQAAYDKEARIIKVGLAVIDWLAENEGKKLTKRNKPQLAAAAARAWGYAEDRVSVWPSYGDLEVSSASYRRTDCREGFSLRLGQGECPIVSVKWFRDRNTWLTAGIENRQPKRSAQLHSGLPEEIDAAMAEYKKAERVTKALTYDLCESHELWKLHTGTRY
jgi:hypothetical protein